LQSWWAGRETSQPSSKTRKKGITSVQSQKFSATSETVNDIVTITLAGELDASVAPQFRSEVEKTSALAPRALVLQMQDLTYMASAGLRVLVFTKQKMGPDVSVYVVAPQEPVLDTLRLSGFHQSVVILDEYDASLIEKS
jgi:anti-anti-sigma factor